MVKRTFKFNKMKPTIDIFIKSHKPDYKFLQYCLQSIAKYATGVNKIILVVPIGGAVEFLKYRPESLP